MMTKGTINGNRKVRMQLFSGLYYEHLYFTAGISSKGKLNSIELVETSTSFSPFSDKFP
jgi:hypothetical protein